MNHLAPLAVILCFALSARLPFFWSTHAPLNDGGMFAQIILDLRANRFLLPRETSYNFEHIPLCYPPLGFYFGALASLVTGQQVLPVVRWLPLLFNLATVAALYFVALELLGTAYLAFCAGVIYAVLPKSSEWLTMGGGLTRSPAELFVLLALWFFLKAIRTGKFRNAALAGCLAGLAALAHPEAAVLVVLTLAVFAFFTPELRRNFPLLVIAGFFCALVIAPWLIWCLTNFGLSPFVGALNTGSTSIRTPVLVLLCWAVLGIVMARMRMPPFAIWMVAIDVLVSRSAPTHAAFVLALFAAWLLGAAVDRLSGRTALGKGNLASAVTGLCCVASLLLSIYYVHGHRFPNDRLRDLIRDTRATLSPSDFEAMDWVQATTPPAARFFVFNQRIDPWFGDLRAEWFPYLARRESVYTAQGKEWLPNHAFQHATEHIPLCQNIHSVRDLVKTIEPSRFDYIFLAGPYDSEHERCAALLHDLPDFKSIYKKGDEEVLRSSASE